MRRKSKLPDATGSPGVRCDRENFRIVCGIFPTPLRPAWQQFPLLADTANQCRTDFLERQHDRWLAPPAG
jgi:hypothetical protein